MTTERSHSRRRGRRIRFGGGLLAVLVGAGVLLPAGPAAAVPHAATATLVSAPAASAPASLPAALSAGQPPAPASAPGPVPSVPPAASNFRASAVPVPPAGITLVPNQPGVPTTPAPPTGTGVAAAGGGCGLVDLACHVTAAINGWFTSLVKSALTPILALLGHSVLATPDLTGPGRVADLWGASAAIANTLVVLLVLAGGALVMGHETLQTRYAAKDVAPRIVVAVIAANASLALAGIAIGLANSLSGALLGPGVNVEGATGVLTALVTSSVTSGGILLILMGLVAAVLGLVLLAVYVIRVALLVVLIAGAPLALVCHALPHTEGLARLWWRAVAGLLAVQVTQTLVLITALRVFFAAGGHGALGLASSGGLVDVLVAICLLYVLVRIPGWVSHAVFAGTGHSPSSTVRAVKTVVVYKTLRAGAGALA